MALNAAQNVPQSLLAIVTKNSSLYELLYPSLSRICWLGGQPCLAVSFHRVEKVCI